MFNPKKFQNLFIRWVQELLDIKLEAGFQVAIDGKSSRNTVDAFGNMLHLLNAYLVEERCILGQHKTDDKSNEMRAIPILLEVLDLKDAIISIDAMGCQKEIAEKIIDQKADYFLALKKNQKTLYEDIETAFLVFNEKTDSEFITEEINGSRVEKRICKVMDDLSHLSTEFHWKGLRKIVKIETETYLKNKQSTRTETRYYITSKDITAERFLQISRNHWMIENKLHWSLDVIMQEDKSRKRNNNVAENFSILLKVILKLLQEKQLQNKRISVKFHNIIDGILSS